MSDQITWSAPRSAYIHVPFCRHRCGYCNFSVITDRDDLVDRYLVAIDRELEALEYPEIDTVFIGGGTPTHLETRSLDRLLTAIGRRFDIVADAEWSVEANPEDITDEKLNLLVNHGVNRISLGVQSFNNDKLKCLQRGHDGESVRQTIHSVADKIPNISLDLIFAAPGETIDSWCDDLDAALSLPIQHLSTYALTFEKGTTFWNRRAKGELHELGDAVEIEMYSLARSRTASAGLKQYEISSFARSRFRCRHNMAYWNCDGGFGAGPGAARFVAGKRETNHRSTTTYLKRMGSNASPISESETESISIELHARERAAFGVRMIDGIDLGHVHSSTGVDVRTLCRAAIHTSVEEGLIDDRDDIISLTERGILFADTVAARFLD
jgi:oxygen-independent coproporphyrinogen-3 oxidase